MSNEALAPEQAHRLVYLRKLIRDTAANYGGHLDSPIYDIDDVTCERIALVIFAAGFVQLPAITDRDDITYWETESDERLRNMVFVDLWNASAALHVQAARRQAASAKLARSAAVFSGRAVTP